MLSVLFTKLRHLCGTVENLLHSTGGLNVPASKVSDLPQDGLANSDARWPFRTLWKGFWSA